MADSDVGGAYEVHASVLRSSRLRGGPLGIPASAGGGSGFAVKVFGSSLAWGSGLGARPVALPFRQRAPFHFFSSSVPAPLVTPVISALLPALTTIVMGFF